MRLKGRIIWFACLLACFGLPSAVPAWAQALSAGSPTSGSSLESLTDVFLARETKGPYVLNWSNVETGSEMVIVSGRTLVRGQDYTIDYASGAIAFTEPLPKDAVVRVTYSGIPEKSKATGGGMDTPISARLLDNDRITLDATGFYRGAGGKGKDQGTGVLGLSSSMKPSEGSDISSTFLITQGSSDDGSDVDAMDRAALKFGGTSEIGNLRMSGSLVRAGEHFAGSKEYGLQHAKELIDLGATWGKTTDVVHASFSYKEQEDLGGAQKGATKTISEQKVALNLKNAPSLTLSRSENENELPTGQVSTTVTDTVQMEQGFGQKTKATASLQTTETSTAGAASEITTTRVGVQSSAIDRVQLQGGVTWREAGQTDEMGVDVGMKVAASARMNVDASYSSLESDASGQQSKTALRIAANPLDKVQLQGGVIWKDSDQTGGETGVDVAIKAAPGSRTNIDASYSNVDSDQTGVQTRTAVKVAARPIDEMKVEASYSGTQLVDGVDEQHRGVRLEAQPVGYMKVSAGLGAKEIGVEQHSTREAAIEVAPNDRMRLATAYRESEIGESVSTVRDYSGALKPVKYMELSGNYRNRELIGAEELNSKALKLALGPSQDFRLTGQYAHNPEDGKGIVQRFTSTTVGVEMKLGIVGLTGGFTEKDNYLAGSSSEERQVGLNLPIFGHGKLTTGYKVAEAISQAQQATETYTIGYTHIIGSSFSLALEGQLTRQELEALVPQDEYKATAKLGMKF